MLGTREAGETGCECAEARIRAEHYVISDNAEKRGTVADDEAEIKPALKEHTDNYQRGDDAAICHANNRSHIQPRYPHREHKGRTDNRNNYRKHFLSRIEFYLFFQFMTSLG